MADLSDFKRGQVVGVRMAGACVTKTAELNYCSKEYSLESNDSIWERRKKPFSLKKNSGRKRKLSDRDRQTLTRIVKKDHKNTALKITAELNDHLENPIPLKTVRRELHKAGFHGRAAIRKPYKICLKFSGVSAILLNTYIYIYIFVFIKETRA